MPTSTKMTKDTQDTLKRLRAVVHHVKLFTEAGDCLSFLNTIKNEQALLITSRSLGQPLVKQVHHLPQVEAIYIFCANPDQHQSWTSQYPKIRGVHNRIKHICEALRTAVKQTNEDLTPISFATLNEGNQKESIVDRTDSNRHSCTPHSSSAFFSIWNISQMKNKPSSPSAKHTTRVIQTNWRLSTSSIETIDLRKPSGGTLVNVSPIRCSIELFACSNQTSSSTWASSSMISIDS